MASSTALSATCYCGAVLVRLLAGAVPQARSACHCTTCRSLSGAPFMANLVLASSVVELVAAADGGAPALLESKTSKHVTRCRCAQCHSPVAASLGPKRTVVPLAMFERGALPAEWRTLERECARLALTRPRSGAAAITERRLHTSRRPPLLRQPRARCRRWSAQVPQPLWWRAVGARAIRQREGDPRCADGGDGQRRADC